jgi:3-oxoacyl-[acyl-carrier protein] reductase
VPGPDPSSPVALVSGSGSNLGRACLAQLRDQGFTTVAAWHTRPPAPGEADAAIQLEVTDATAVEAAVEAVEAEHGPIHTVVAAAGFAHLDLALRVTPEQFRDVVDIDLTGAFLLARAAARAMAPRRAGRIVLVGSVAGIWGVPGVSSYAAAKAGLGGLARSLARELGPRGITVNVVAPGLLDDAVTRLVTRRPGSSTDREWVASTPAGRSGTPEEVAAVVAFLAGPSGASITGATLAVDGGFSIGPG